MLLNGNGEKVDDAVLIERLTRQDVTLSAINVNLATLSRQIDKQNGRVRGLENWRWMLTGGLGVITFLMGAGVVTAVALAAG
jgi:ribosomal 50S subunit-associated protein YjgA (DUF615 family)